MKRFRLSRQADADLDEIADYIADHNPSAAGKQIDVFFERFAMLAANPLMGEAWDRLRVGLRAFVVGNYIIFYVPLEDGIEVERIIHGARDFESLF